MGIFRFYIISLVLFTLTPFNVYFADDCLDKWDEADREARIADSLENSDFSEALTHYQNAIKIIDENHDSCRILDKIIVENSTLLGSNLYLKIKLQKIPELERKIKATSSYFECAKYISEKMNTNFGCIVKYNENCTTIDEYYSLIKRNRKLKLWIEEWKLCNCELTTSNYDSLYQKVNNYLVSKCYYDSTAIYYTKIAQKLYLIGNDVQGGYMLQKALKAINDLSNLENIVRNLLYLTRVSVESDNIQLINTSTSRFESFIDQLESVDSKTRFYTELVEFYINLKKHNDASRVLNKMLSIIDSLKYNKAITNKISIADFFWEIGESEQTYKLLNNAIDEIDKDMNKIQLENNMTEIRNQSYSEYIISRIAWNYAKMSEYNNIDRLVDRFCFGTHSTRLKLLIAKDCCSHKHDDSLFDVTCDKSYILKLVKQAESEIKMIENLNNKCRYMIDIATIYHLFSMKKDVISILDNLVDLIEDNKGIVPKYPELNLTSIPALYYQNGELGKAIQLADNLEEISQRSEALNYMLSVAIEYCDKGAIELITNKMLTNIYAINSYLQTKLLENLLRVQNSSLPIAEKIESLEKILCNSLLLKHPLYRSEIQIETLVYLSKYSAEITPEMNSTVVKIISTTKVEY